MTGQDWYNLASQVGFPLALLGFILWSGRGDAPLWQYGPQARAAIAATKEATALQVAAAKEAAAQQRADLLAQLAQQRADSAARLKDAQDECMVWRDLALRSTVLADRATEHASAAVAVVARRGGAAPGGGGAGDAE